MGKAALPWSELTERQQLGWAPQCAHAPAIVTGQGRAAAPARAVGPRGATPDTGPEQRPVLRVRQVGRPAAPQDDETLAGSEGDRTPVITPWLPTAAPWRRERLDHSPSGRRDARSFACNEVGPQAPRRTGRARRTRSAARRRGRAFRAAAVLVHRKLRLQRGMPGCGGEAGAGPITPGSGLTRVSVGLVSGTPLRVRSGSVTRYPAPPPAPPHFMRRLARDTGPPHLAHAR